VIGFVHPAAWVLATLFGVLVALYLWERSRRRIEVASLLLWRVIPEAVVHTRRFRPDWLFWLQALLLGLLIAGLADPYLRDRVTPASAARAIFVIDLSASMQAQEGRETRFELARDAIRTRIAALHDLDEAMLIGAALHPIVAAPFSRDHAEVLRQLDALEPIDARAALDAALAVADRAAETPERPATIELFTDLPREDLAERWRNAIGVVQLGETDDNLAIDAVQVSQGRFQDYRDAHAYVAVRNFAHREAHGILTLDLDGALVTRRGFTIAARSVQGFPVASLPAAGVLRASLDVEDALAIDNRAYAYVRPVRPLHVLAVTDAPPMRRLLERLAIASPHLQFAVVSPEEYRDAAGADLLLFDHVAPPFPATAPSLYVAPDGGPFPARGALRAAPIVDWNARHPALAGIRPDGPFALMNARDLAVPDWADALVTSNVDGHEIALVLAGETGGHRRAALAFDLDAENLLGPDHANLLMLFLNLLDWLAPAEEPVRIVQTGEVGVIDELPAAPRTITAPDARTTVVAADAPLTIEAARTGEYRIDAGGTSMRVFANFIDPLQSDIGRARQTTSRAPVRAVASTPTATPRGWSQRLYLIAAALLLVEWFAARGRAG
jgi:hypothetical protein